MQPCDFFFDCICLLLGRIYRRDRLERCFSKAVCPVSFDRNAPVSIGDGHILPKPREFLLYALHGGLYRSPCSIRL